MKKIKGFIFLVILLTNLILINDIIHAQGSSKALLLNGANQYVDLGNDPRLNIDSAITIEAWIKPENYSRTRSIVSKGSYSFKIGPDNLPYFEIIDGQETISETSFLSNNNIYAMTTYKGKLYVGLSNIQSCPYSGHVYRYEGENTWTDVGKLGTADCVYSLLVYNDSLYAGTGYLGRVYKYAGENFWMEVGSPGLSCHTRVLAVFNEKLYAGTDGRVFRYAGNRNWEYAGRLGVDNQIMALCVYNGKLYGGGYYSKKVYVFDGNNTWNEAGLLNGAGSYILSFAVYKGQLYAGTGSGTTSNVFRYDGNASWSQVGELGSWIASMIVYNGNLYAGTSNAGASIYRYESDNNWIKVANLGSMDQVWSMAGNDGKIFIGAGNPFGNFSKVFSLGKGVACYSNQKIKNKFSHVAALYDGNQLKVFINGFETGHCYGSIKNSGNNLILLIGNSYGSNQCANTCGGEECYVGNIDEVRIWKTALDKSTIRDWMCKKVTLNHPQWDHILCYHRFDELSNNMFRDLSGNEINGITKNLIDDSALVFSGAAIGDDSFHDYVGNSTHEYVANLSHLDGDKFIAASRSDSAFGLQVYRVDDKAMRNGVTAPDSNWCMDKLRYWGVFCVGSINSTYNVTYNYDGHPGINNESDLDLAYKQDNSSNHWNAGNAMLNGLSHSLQILNQTESGMYSLGSRMGQNTLPVDTNHLIIKEFLLLQNYPNPFNPSTVICYQLPTSSDITLKVFDVLGNEVASIINEYKSAGRYEVEFNASALPSGVYFYRLIAGDFFSTKKMLLLK